MKKKLIKILSLVLAVATLTACAGATADGGKNKGSNGGAAKTYSEHAQELAKEYVNRHITAEDEINEEIIEALIEEIKIKYPFEEGVKEIKLAEGDNVFIGEGKGWYKQLFVDQGIKVTIVEGAENYEEELMARGDLDFANRMLYPFLLNKEKGADLVAVWATNRPAPGIVNVIVRSDSGYEKFEDLKGKTIATSASSCPYVVTEELIIREQWEVGKDVNVINTQEYVNALLAGEVDAIIYHPNTPVNPILLSGECKAIENAPEDGVYVGGGGLRVIFTTNEFATKYPNVTKAYTKIQEAIQAWEFVDTDAAAGIYESVSRVPKENAIYWWNAGKETRFAWTDGKESLQEATENFYDWLIEYDQAFDGGADLEHCFAEGYFD